MWDKRISYPTRSFEIQKAVLTDDCKKKTLLLSVPLLLQPSPACLVRLTWMVCEMAGKAAIS